MPQRNPEASYVEEGAVGGEQMFVANQQSAELTKPGIRSLHDPTAFVASQFASFFVAPSPIVEVIDQRQRVLDAAYARNPERFTHARPKHPPQPTAVWINPPTSATEKLASS